MIKPIVILAAHILLEAVIGLAAAAAALALSIPLLIRRNLIVPGDPAGSLIITGVLVCAIGAMLFRPGSAINRYGKRDG